MAESFNKLTYSDTKKPVVIQIDASGKGHIAVLLLDYKPVAFMSKSITDLETHYANIECKLFVIVFAVLKFYTYIYSINYLQGWSQIISLKWFT